MSVAYTVIKTTRFKRDYNKDHPLKGEWAGSRECHIGGPKSDWLLVYDKNDTAFILQLMRTGTHQDLKIGEK